METIGALEAETHLAEILDRVERGESLTITRQGKAVAHLVPADRPPTRSRIEAIRELREFGNGHRLDGLKIRDLIDEGRRI
jgi:prevent-host-death family protein